MRHFFKENLGYSFLPAWETITNSKAYITGGRIMSHDQFDDAHYCGDLKTVIIERVRYELTASDKDLVPENADAPLVVQASLGADGFSDRDRHLVDKLTSFFSAGIIVTRVNDTVLDTCQSIGSLLTVAAAVGDKEEVVGPKLMSKLNSQIKEWTTVTQSGKPLKQVGEIGGRTVLIDIYLTFDEKFLSIMLGCANKHARLNFCWCVAGITNPSNVCAKCNKSDSIILQPLQIPRQTDVLEVMKKDADNPSIAKLEGRSTTNLSPPVMDALPFSNWVICPLHARINIVRNMWKFVRSVVNRPAELGTVAGGCENDPGNAAGEGDDRMDEQFLNLVFERTGLFLRTLDGWNGRECRNVIENMDTIVTVAVELRRRIGNRLDPLRTIAEHVGRALDIMAQVQLPARTSQEFRRLATELKTAAEEYATLWLRYFHKQPVEGVLFRPLLYDHLLVSHTHEHWVECGGIGPLGDQVHEAVHPATRRNVKDHAPSDARSKGEISRHIILRQQQQAGAGNGYKPHGKTGKKRRKTTAES